MPKNKFLDFIVSNEIPSEGLVMIGVDQASGEDESIGIIVDLEAEEMLVMRGFTGEAGLYALGVSVGGYERCFRVRGF
ncbi:MAG: hypothetical protein FVQ79_02285 [Planctomycetes bacterium]|nr:hypothetical protein [Planctomycetota bacterium]